MSRLPRIMLTAPSSGSGKTTVTCAILQALVGRGMKPVSFKSGPDHIDPMFHTEVIGAKSANLDLFFMNENTTRHLMRENGKDRDIAIIEGAMGYYDGIAMGADASAYSLMLASETPAVLVIDARGQALSAAALVKGFAGFRTDSGICGVILNRISSTLYPRFKACIEAETGMRVYGFLPEEPECVIESRHLGLVTAGEISDLKQKLNLLAQRAEETIDINGLIALSKAAPEIAECEITLPKPVAGNPKMQSRVIKRSAFIMRIR